MLTEAGTDLMPVVWAMFEWGGRKHLKDSGLRLTHLDCGSDAGVEVRCTQATRCRRANSVCGWPEGGAQAAHSKRSRHPPGCHMLLAEFEIT